MDYAWLAPVLCAGAVFVNVIVWRQFGRARHALSALTSVAAILVCFGIFV